MKFLPRISNEVFEDQWSAKNVEMREFDLHLDSQYSYFFNKLFSDVTYDETRYQNEQALSVIFRSHLESVVELVKENFSYSDSLVEVGCGKATFFNLLSNSGFRNLRGFDRTYQGSDPRITKDYLSDFHKPLSADGILLRHVLEHIPDPVRFLADLEQINQKSLKFVIEVPSMEWSIRANAYWDFGYEHANHFTVDSFKKIFKECKIYRVFSEQYLLVIADSSSLVERVRSDSEPSAEFEKMLDESLANNSLTKFARGGGRYWVWGAGGKGVLLMFHLMQIKSSKIQPPLGVIDINPAKQNNFLASSALPIVSPRSFFRDVRENDVIFVTNPNYKDEILAFIQANCSIRVDLVIL